MGAEKQEESLFQKKGVDQTAEMYDISKASETERLLPQSKEEQKVSDFFLSKINNILVNHF